MRTFLPVFLALLSKMKGLRILGFDRSFLLESPLFLMVLFFQRYIKPQQTANAVKPYLE